jgi:4-hydroxybenzoate polyprenyltransferase
VRTRLDRQTREKPAPADHRGLKAARVSLIGSVFVFMGLAYLLARWLPNEAFIAFVFVFFAAHTAAYLLLKEVRGYNDDKPSGDQ